MSKIIVEGKRRLAGKIRVHGAKNAVLPILAATILNGDESVIYDCPRIKDVDVSIEILRHLGCTVHWEDGALIVNSRGVSSHHIPESLMRESRASVVFLGALLTRCGHALISYPGGCVIGPRPIDLHLKAFNELGVKIEETHGFVSCATEGIIPGDIHLDFPSVGATQNVMLACCMARGTIRIYNAAQEPEIIDLQTYLNNCGCNIHGAGTPVIEIVGVERLHSATHTVIPDRIVAATYMAATVMAGGYIELQNVVYEHLTPVVSVMRDMGAHIDYHDGSVLLRSPRAIEAIPYLRTMPHPGFPTDAQALAMSVLTLARGTSIICEHIFESRYAHTTELAKMGADVTVDGRLAVIRGVGNLWGAKLSIPDLRAGAALVVAALGAVGTSELTNIHYLDRGYDGLVEGLAALGANISRLEE